MLLAFSIQAYTLPLSHSPLSDPGARETGFVTEPNLTRDPSIHYEQSIPHESNKARDLGTAKRIATKKLNATQQLANQRIFTPSRYVKVSPHSISITGPKSKNNPNLNIELFRFLKSEFKHLIVQTILTGYRKNMPGSLLL